MEPLTAMAISRDWLLRRASGDILSFESGVSPADSGMYQKNGQGVNSGKWVIAVWRERQTAR